MFRFDLGADLSVGPLQVSEIAYGDTLQRVEYLRSAPDSDGGVVVWGEIGTGIAVYRFGPTDELAAAYHLEVDWPLSPEVLGDVRPLAGAAATPGGLVLGGTADVPGDVALPPGRTVRVRETVTTEELYALDITELAVTTSPGSLTVTTDDDLRGHLDAAEAGDPDVYLLRAER